MSGGSDPADDRQRIERQRVAAEARLRAHEQALAELSQARGGADADDEHDPEGATISDEWSRLEGLRADAERELAALVAAVGRLDAGSYGTCADCGERIPSERMAVVPTATRCVSCASRRR